MARVSVLRVGDEKELLQALDALDQRMSTRVGGREGGREGGRRDMKKIFRGRQGLELTLFRGLNSF
jgi:hypothetical protein